MDEPAQELELLVRIAQTVAVGQIKDLSVDFSGQRLSMQGDTAFFFQVAKGPDVVVAGEVVHLDAHIGQFRYFSQKTAVAARYDILEFEPVVEHIAQR